MAMLAGCLLPLTPGSWFFLHRAHLCPGSAGIDELASYPTARLFALEVYSEGAEIRAFTYNFMQRMAHQPMPLIPVSLWP